MKPASTRITSGPIDPDLEAVLPGLARDARRLRQIESIILLPEKRYGQTAAIRAERGEIFAAFTGAAEKLNIGGERPGRAMLILTEEADRLFQAGRRRPTLAQVLDKLRAVHAVAERDLSTAECDLIDAQARVLEARARAAGCEAAVAYLEASR